MQTENNTPRDLIAELAAVTEVKTPSAAPVIEWNFENPDKTPVAVTTESTPATIPGTNPAPITPGQQTPQNTLSLKERKLDAEASQAGVEFLTAKAAEIAISIKYSRKFTKEEKDALNGDLLHRKPEDLNDIQAQLVARWNATVKIKDKKLKKVELSDKQRERMVRAFERYSEATGKTFLTPGSMLGISILEQVMDSAFEIFID